MRKYRTFTKQLTDFSDKRGYVISINLHLADIDVFYSGGISRALQGQTSRHAAAFFRSA